MAKFGCSGSVLQPFHELCSVTLGTLYRGDSQTEIIKDEVMNNALPSTSLVTLNTFIKAL